MKNEIIVIGNVEKPNMPAKWDYDESVKRVKGFVYKVKNLTVDMLCELYIAREMLSKRGSLGHVKNNTNGTIVPLTWASYCRDIGSSKQVVNRWLKPRFPELAEENGADTCKEYTDTTEATSSGPETTTESKPDNADEPATEHPKSTFNRTNDNIEWAHWTWNPVTGCKHGCVYCYARDIAVRFGSDENSPFYPHKFAPHFYPERLDAPFNTKIPATNDISDKNVFCVSMGDLFGAWVKQDWIDKVIEVVKKAPQWNFIFLTKNPTRLIEIEWPDNAWVGTTVDEQARVEPAEEAFAQIEAKVKFVSIEPFRGRITFNHMTFFNWIIVGGQSRSTGEPEQQPEWEWVDCIYKQAREAGCMIYFKPNLKVVQPKEYPHLVN